jgi:hypothetical protein
LVSGRADQLLAKRTHLLIAAVATALGAAIAAAALASQTNGNTSPRELATFRAPLGTAYSHPVWVPSLKKLVVQVTTLRNFDEELGFLDLESGTLTRINIRTELRCPLQSAEIPQLIHSVDIIFLRRCYGNPNLNDRRFTQVDIVKLGHQEPSKWRPYFLPNPTNSLAVSSDGTRAIINDALGFHMHLRDLGPLRLSPPLPLPWDRAGSLAWSPIGRWLAAEGVPLKSSSGLDTLARPSNLYLLDRALKIRRTLVRSLKWMSTPAWSPNSRTIAISAQPATGQPGIYLVDVTSGRRTLLKAGAHFTELTWIGDRELAAVENRFSGGDPRIRIFLLPSTSVR